ncbi:hypothetical protein M8J76_013425 [Diaphorina citri]|nr:hypothetical protein M8J75_001458 [Diaphorina citri]KAI5733568.1 hypothetical protein M8J76_013425 [Diaphorina citri]
MKSAKYYSKPQALGLLKSREGVMECLLKALKMGSADDAIEQKPQRNQNPSPPCMINDTSRVQNKQTFEEEYVQCTFVKANALFRRPHIQHDIDNTLLVNGYGTDFMEYDTQNSMCCTNGDA